MKTALEIAHEAKLRPIADIAKDAGILPEELEQSGQYRGKVIRVGDDQLMPTPERVAALARGQRRPLRLRGMRPVDGGARFLDSHVGKLCQQRPRRRVEDFE